MYASGQYNRGSKDNMRVEWKRRKLVLACMAALLGGARMLVADTPKTAAEYKASPR